MPPCRPLKVTLSPEQIVQFPWQEGDEIFLLFVWIHILQQGIWDMETRKLSRPRTRNSLISSLKPLPSPNPTTLLYPTLRTWRKP